MSRQMPIDRAYQAANDAITRDCSRCGAPAGTWCSKPDGRLARIPCLVRAKSASSDWAKSARASGAGGNEVAVVDFSEPRYTSEAS